MSDSALLPILPRGRHPGFLSLGVVGYDDERPITQTISFYLSEKEDTEVEFETEDYSARQSPFGISYFGDFKFVQMVIQAAIDAKLLKPVEILTLREAVDLARVLLRFLIDFQKFMVMSTVNYPIESADITKRAGVQAVDVMRIDPMPTRQSYGQET